MASKGSRAIKVSAELGKFLEQLKSRSEGYDGLLRHHFGLPPRTKKNQELAVYYVIDSEGELVIHRTLAEAQGAAILLAVKRGQKMSHKKRKDRVMVVRELP